MQQAFCAGRSRLFRQLTLRLEEALVLAETCAHAWPDGALHPRWTLSLLPLAGDGYGRSW